jgi:hypothetical protein
MWRPKSRKGVARDHASVTLLHRAQQWLAARERLLSAWVARTHVRARIGMRHHLQLWARERNRNRNSIRIDNVGRVGAIKLPQWWEYESPMKRRLALEALLRRMFSMLPEMAVSP